MDDNPDVESLIAGGPAAKARRRGDAGDPGRRRRPYALPNESENQYGDALALAATRALLRSLSRDEAALVLRTVVEDLGGVVVPARLATDDALPLDISLGVDEPSLVEVTPGSPSYDLVTRHLSELVADAHTVANRSDMARQQQRKATVDALTGAATRREIGRQLGSAEPGDAVCLLDLDGFKQLNDSRGHAAGDDALRNLGRLLRTSIRNGDFVGRYGGDEFVLLLRSTDTESARARMLAVAERWRALGDHGTTASIGVAGLDHRGGALAAKAADAALYRAKRAGRDRVEVAADADYPELTGTSQDDV